MMWPKNYGITNNIFKGKVVLCNCDDPTWSAFWKYIPWSKGGRTVDENLQMLCKKCNNEKMDK